MSAHGKPTAVLGMLDSLVAVLNGEAGETHIDGTAVRNARNAVAELIEAANALADEAERLTAIVNTPQSDDFLRAVSTEAEHQRQRWGNEHDAGKTPADWFWLIGYLAGKALHAQAGGNVEKAEHHVITTAAACANWHRAMFGGTDMRPGIEGESALAEQQTAGEKA